MTSRTSGDETTTDELEEQGENSNEKTRARRVCRKLFKDGNYVWKPVLLAFLNGVYLLLGGAVFLFLEEKEPAVELNIPNEIVSVLQVLNETRPDIINSSLSRQVIRETAENMTARDLEKWGAILETVYERRRARDKYPRWTIFRSIFFCTTLLTTIGYGNIAPVTTPGRIFCVIYAFIGIPFNIMFLAVLGKLLADVINKICAEIIRIWTSYLHPNYEWKSLKGESDINAPVWLGLIILGSFLCFCAWIYSISEGWDYWTACYFTFITFTTIGLGDIVPKKTETMLFIDTTLLYLGLAVLALTVNLIVANILHQMRKTRNKLMFVNHLELSSVSSEDKDKEKD